MTIKDAKPLPSQATLRELLEYDPQTGNLFWKERSLSRFSSNSHGVTWNKRFAGRKAFGSKTKDGYCKSDVEGVRVYAHRVIWKWMLGTEPGQEIDHIDGDRSNNSWVNLRSVDRPENTRNKRISSRNTSGVCGVHRHKGGWIAEINTELRQRQYLGCFSTLDQATQARKLAEQQYGYHQNHGRAT